MGSFHSLPSRSGRRRANRLSKPLTNKACLSPISRKSTPVNSKVTSPASPRPAPRNNPLGSTSVPASPPVSDRNSRLPQSLPSATSQSEVPRRASVLSSRNEPIAEEGNPEELLHDLPSPNPSAAASMNRRPSLRPTRRASFQPDALRNASKSGSTPGQPKRTHSLQSFPQSPKGTIYEDALEEATSSNTYFMVDNQRFSITRRRSLLTRPGVATRKSSRQSVRRLAPPISQEPENPSDKSFEKQTPLQPPFPPEGENAAAESVFASTSARPDTSSDFEYTHLGALKLGSLRVVNGSASPSSSDRTLSNIPRSTSPQLSSDNAHTGKSTVLNHAGEANDPRVKRVGYVAENTSNLAGSDASMLQISTSPDTKTQEDAPGSPFSFEKSPTIATYPGHASFFTQENEGISLTNEKNSIKRGASLLWNTHMRPHSRKRHSRLPAKADSGYSSSTSARSSQDKPTKGSMDSQRPDIGSRKDSVKREFKGHEYHVENALGLNYLAPIQRRLSLRTPKSGRSQQLPPDRQPRNPRFADYKALSHAGSFSRPFVTDTTEVPLSQRQRADNIGGRASHSYQNFHASGSSSPRLSRHKSISVAGSGEQRIGDVTGKYNVQGYTRFNADAPHYDRFEHDRFAHSRSQKLSTHRSSTTRTKHPKQTRADMVNEHYHQPNNNLGGKAVSPRHSTDFALRKSISYLEKVEPVEEKDYVPLSGRSYDGVRNPNIDDQQQTYARPLKRRSLYMSTSPFIFK